MKLKIRIIKLMSREHELTFMHMSIKLCVYFIKSQKKIVI